jgi:hypothetical protein
MKTRCGRERLRDGEIFIRIGCYKKGNSIQYFRLEEDFYKIELLDSKLYLGVSPDFNSIMIFLCKMVKTPGGRSTITAPISVGVSVI